jgi:hypothetical protein
MFNEQPGNGDKCFACGYTKKRYNDNLSKFTDEQEDEEERRDGFVVLKIELRTEENDWEYRSKTVRLIACPECGTIQAQET